MDPREQGLEPWGEATAPMHAYCQHCDRHELVAPEDIYSPEFNFWCPRCQSILILTSELGRKNGNGRHPASAPDAPARHEAITRVDTEERSSRLPETRSDDEGRPPRPRAIESFDAAADELGGGIFSDAREALRELDSRDRPTERVGEPEDPTRAWSDRDRERAALDEDRPPPATVGPTDFATRASGPGRPRAEQTSPSAFAETTPPLPRRSLTAPAPPVDFSATRTTGTIGASGPSTGEIAMARETVRVKRPIVPGKLADKIAESIAPGAPPLPNWDGGDTQEVIELAESMPEGVEMTPALSVRGNLREPEPVFQDEDVIGEEAPGDPDPLDQIAVVEMRRGTTGLGSRTYERHDVTPRPPVVARPSLGPPSDKDSLVTEIVEPGPAEPGPGEEKPAAPLPALAPAVPSSASSASSPVRKTEDLDWYALIDEALPESPEQAAGAAAAAEDPARVVIRLPETMAPKSEADAEQVRQLQATLEARGLEKHEEQRFDPKLVENPPKKDDGEGTARTPRADIDTRRDKDLAGTGKADLSRTGETQRDNLSGTGKTPRDFTPPVDSDAPTKIVGTGTITLQDQIKKLGDEKDASSGTGTAKVDVSRTPGKPLPAVDKKNAATGVIESFDRAELDPGLVCVLDSSSREADYFKQLYQRIFHSRNGSSPRVVLVTSARRGEGKTTVAANLAVVASRMPGGGALLVEADPRGGDLMHSFGVKKKFEGLLDALESRKDPSSFLVPFKLGYALHVLPLGVPGSNAAELISSDRIGEVLHGLAGTHPNAVVIVDGSAVLHAPDPLAITRHVDGVVLVVRAGETPREQVERALDLLGPEKVLGVVLNDAATSVA